MRRRFALGAPLAWGLSLAACQKRAPTPLGGFTDDAPERGHYLNRADGAAPLAPPQPQFRTQVLIVGAGIAGLAAARALRQRGVEDFLVIDLHDQAGGNARGGELAGLSHPLGAHYLPLPGDDAPELLAWMEELGLRQRRAGRWVWDERHLCHSPQERVFVNGEWQEGLLPAADPGSSAARQYQAFGAWVRDAQGRSRFAVPAARGGWNAAQAELDRVTFAQALDARGLDDPGLRWYLDYCCRDDFGAPAAAVSAWAGLHYFASRHGFLAHGEAGVAEPVLTWPEGNAWLVRRLSDPLGERMRLGLTALRAQETRDGVQVIAHAHALGQRIALHARQLILAVPVHVAARLWPAGPGALHEARRRMAHAAWVVVNARLSRPLVDRGGAAPAWDNVIAGSAGLGYVNAGHQRLDPRPGPTVLSWYHALGSAPEAREALQRAPWTHWWTQMQTDLATAHPELLEQASHVSVTRHGHAMVVPTPGLQTWLAGLSPGPRLSPLGQGRIWLAHSDWAGYSVLEEAFVRGDIAGRRV